VLLLLTPVASASVYGTNRTVWALGFGGVGQLGNNAITNCLLPIAVDGSGVLAGKTVIAVAAGNSNSHSLALCSDGSVAAWGGGGSGQLGNNATTSSSVPVAVYGSGLLAGKTVIAVAAGVVHSLALCSDGTVAAWGFGGSGRLGNNSSTSSSVPVAVDGSGVLAGKTVTAVAAGNVHSLALCSDGTVAAWGAGAEGQLGNNATTDSSVPVAVVQSGVLAGKTVVAVAGGRVHSLALCSDGTVAAWGSGSNGQLGNNATTNSLMPVAVVRSGVLAGRTVIAVAAGNSHSLALCSDGTVAAWGAGGSGQLGNNASTNSLVPVAVTVSGVLAGKTVVAVAAGNAHSLALCSDGTVAAWGEGGSGQLGNNATTDSSVPVAVSTSALPVGARFVGLAAGASAHHNLALVGTPLLPPSITVAPTGASFTLGQGLTLSVTAAGTTPLAYQWQFNGTNIPGATGASLTLTNLTALHAGAYRLTVSNAAGTNTSAMAELFNLGDLKLLASVVLAGPIGRQFRVDYADVVTVGTTNWITLTNMTLPYSPFLVVDPSSAGRTQRYYRAVPVP